MTANYTVRTQIFGSDASVFVVFDSPIRDILGTRYAYTDFLEALEEVEGVEEVYDTRYTLTLQIAPQYFEPKTVIVGFEKLLHKYTD